MKQIFLLLSAFLLLSGATNATDYFVKVTATGNGDGISWDNAMSGETFISKLASGIVAGDVIYMAGGIYKPQTVPATSFVEINNAITIIGGFAPDITGSTDDITYPSSTPTIFSGDINDDGITDSGDSPVVYISSSGETVLKGIRVTGGYSTTARRPGIHVDGGTVSLYYCTIDNNVTTKDDPTGEGGGAGIYSDNATIYAYRSVISDNTAATRGGGIRLANAAVLMLESCLITKNVVTGDFGGGIQGSGNLHKIYCVNTTIANNSVRQHGAGINSPGQVYLISSTIVNNTASTPGGDGLNIRYESNEMYVINSIITGSEGEADPHIYLNGDNKKITSAGHNIFGTVHREENSVFETQSSDQTETYYAAIFGNNTLADNGGYPQTIALSSALSGSPIGDLNTFKSNNQITFGDVAKDQRGFSRNTAEAVNIGAYEYDAQGSGVKAVQSGQYLIYPTKASESVTLAGVENARISIVNVSGVQLLSINRAKNVEYIPLANYPKGIYFVLVNGTATKIIKE